MKAVEALQLGDRAFRAAVEEALQLKQGDHAGCCICNHCGRIVWGSEPLRPDMSFADLAFFLRDALIREDKLQALRYSASRLRPQVRPQVPPQDIRYIDTAGAWYAYDATPQEQIACALAALGKWEL